MNTKTDSIWAAAEHLLRRDAEELRESSTSSRDRDDWTGEEEAKADYDEHIAAADALAALTTAAVPLQIKAPPNIEGETQLIVRWLVETPAGRVGAWNRASLEYLLGNIPAQAAPAAVGQPAMTPAHQRALENVALLADILNRRPAMNAGSSEAYAHWTAEVYNLMGAMAAEPANDAAAPKAAPAAAAPEYPQMPEMWHVDAHVLGEKILSIGNDWLSGKDELTEAEKQAVIGMAQTLLSFVGYGMLPSSFDPDADDDDGQAQRDQEVGRQWRLNSSLEKWFPLTAEKLERLQAAFAARVDASEREAFEAQFPAPGGVNWNGSEYVVEDDCLNSYSCDRFVCQWAAWQARASSGQAPAPAAPQGDAEVLLIAAVDEWFAKNTGLGGCSDKDVRELRAIFAAHPTAPAAQGDALKELLAASNDLVETIEMMDEDALLALDDDPHPPSSLSACAERLRKAIDAARAAKEGGAT